jgi:hypothetical protein
LTTFAHGKATAEELTAARDAAWAAAKDAQINQLIKMITKQQGVHA